MKLSGIVVKILFAWALCEAARIAAGYAFPAAMKSAEQHLIWRVFVDLLMIAALGFSARRSGWNGLRVGVAAAMILFAIDAANLVEGIMFLGVVDLRSIYQEATTCGLMIPIMGTSFRGVGPLRGQSSGFMEPIPAGTKLARFIACDVLYASLYFAAGMAIFPFVREFYADHPPPSLGKIALLQLLLRGPIFTAVCLLLMRMGGVPQRAGLSVGATFAVLSAGVLLLPNPRLPDSIRWIHCAEVGTSDFLFGVVVAWIWRPRGIAAHALTQKA